MTTDEEYQAILDSTVEVCTREVACRGPAVAWIYRRASMGIDDGLCCEYHVWDAFQPCGYDGFKLVLFGPLDNSQPWLPPGVTRPASFYDRDWSDNVNRGTGLPIADPAWQPEVPPQHQPRPPLRRGRTVTIPHAEELVRGGILALGGLICVVSLVLALRALTS